MAARFVTLMTKHEMVQNVPKQENAWMLCKQNGQHIQKCKWQVTAKHACTLRMWLCMK